MNNSRRHNTFIVTGVITSGRGKAQGDLKKIYKDLYIKTGLCVIPGTLNIVLDEPILLKDNKAHCFENGHRMFWIAETSGHPILIYRWKGAPLHIFEILSPIHLRNTLNLRDNNRIKIEIQRNIISPLTQLKKLTWLTLWKYREKTYYTHNIYRFFAKYLSCVLGATQSGDYRVPIHDLIRYAKKIDMISRAFNKYGSIRAKIRPYNFSRKEIDPEASPTEAELTKTINLLEYAKTSDSSYSAKKYEGGYQTIEVLGNVLRGQRDPKIRLSQVPFDFTDKTVLDIGSNQGGMLHAIAKEIKWGIGIDYDYKMINVANKIKSLHSNHHLQFYTFNLNKDPLDLIKDMIPDRNVDIVFLLSVCMWIEKWKDVIRLCTDLSDKLLFETNGSPRQQDEQENEIRKLYNKVKLLHNTSPDDTDQKMRKTFFCEI